MRGNIASPARSHEQHEALRDRNNGFLTYLPAVENHASITFRGLPESEREEAIAEAVASAYCNYESVQERGKTGSVSPATLSRYAVLHVKTGRHVGGTQENTTDVLSWRAASRRGFRVYSLHGIEQAENGYDCLAQTENPVWRLSLLECPDTPVPDQAAFRIDWSRFLSRQTDTNRQIIAKLAEGYQRCELAEQLGLTRPALTLRMQAAERRWVNYLGEENGDSIRRGRGE